MTGKNIRLTIFVILALACISISIYLYRYHGHFSFSLFWVAWVFAAIGILTYYSTKSEDHEEDEHHDTAENHGH